MITRYDHYEFQDLSPIQRRQKILEYLKDIHDWYGVPMDEIIRQYDAAIVVMNARAGYWT